MTITPELLVQREVHYCVSHLVSTLASGGNGPIENRELLTLADQAYELAAPIPDYEEAAKSEGWRKDSNGFYLSHDFEPIEASDWQELCEKEGIDPYHRDVYEHWIVSDWLADKLAAKGELVDKDFAGLTVWGRTTTGQAIASDWVIEAIRNDLNAGKGEAA